MVKVLNVIAACGLGLSALSGCYETPGEVTLEEIIVLEFIDLDDGHRLEQDELPPADGVSTVGVRITVHRQTDPAKGIRLETTVGVLDTTQDPTDAASRAIVLSNTGSGIIETTLRVGTTPGDIELTASVDHFRRTKIMTLTAAHPEVVIVTADTASLMADGRAKIEVNAQALRADSTASVSDGQRIRFAVCCLDDEPCDPPLQLPSEVVLGPDRSAMVVGTVDRRGGETPFRVRLVAAAASADADVDICVDSGSVFDVFMLEIRPIDLCADDNVTCDEREVCQPALGQCEPLPASCGDGHVDDDEQCDDGNSDTGDGCDAQCRIEVEEPAEEP